MSPSIAINLLKRLTYTLSKSEAKFISLVKKERILKALSSCICCLCWAGLLSAYLVDVDDTDPYQTRFLVVLSSAVKEGS